MNRRGGATLAAAALLLGACAGPTTEGGNGRWAISLDTSGAHLVDD